jgi:hypothetical protein
LQKVPLVPRWIILLHAEHPISLSLIERPSLIVESVQIGA